MTESEKTQLSYLLIPIFQMAKQEDHSKKKVDMMLERIEEFNGPFSDNVNEVLSLVMAALEYAEEA